MDYEALVKNLRKSFDLRNVPGDDAMAAWFLGPRGESQEFLKRLIALALDDVCATRRTSYSEDPRWANTTTFSYQSSCDEIETQLTLLMRRLADSSIPWYSYRYHGHMNWDNTLPAVAGYFGAMLYNQNNVAAEGGPVTTALEMEVAADLCRMIGFSDATSWAHITCGGTVANIEAIWAARNAKLYPIAVRHALRNELKEVIDEFKIRVTGTGEEKPLADLELREALNLELDAILEVPSRLLKIGGVTNEHLEIIDKSTVQKLGLASFGTFHSKSFGNAEAVRNAIEGLAAIAPASAHYSLPKAATLLGLGAESMVQVKIDQDARMDTDELACVLAERNQRGLPTLAVVAVIGSTQEGAVDDLGEIIRLRNDFRESGYDFIIHCDAAWGGYFASLLKPPELGTNSRNLLDRAGQIAGDPPVVEVHDPVAEGKNNARAALEAWIQLQPETKIDGFDQPTNERFVHRVETTVSRYVELQLQNMKYADSVTIDPHKAGFIPYPAGALCYRNRFMPDMVQVTAPIVFHGGEAPTLGVFGIEGSTAGAAPAAVWMSHRIIRPDQSGYGKVLGRCIYNSKRLFVELATMTSEYFKLSTIRQFSEEEIDFMKAWKGKGVAELWKHLAENPNEASLFRRIGSDLNIVPFAANFYCRDSDANEGELNADPHKANEFNDMIFRKLSIESEGDENPEVVITGSSYDANVATKLVENLRSDLGIAQTNYINMNFLLSTTMNPWLCDADGGNRNMAIEVGEKLKSGIESVAKEFQQLS